MNRISGIIAPIITPLNLTFLLDSVSLEKIIEHIIDGGVKAIFALGTTGEFSSLSLDLKNEVIQKTCLFVKKRISTLIGISSCDWQESLALAETAFLNKADAVVATPPYYFDMSQDDIIGYYSDLADRVKLPLYLYNMPSLTKINIEPETVKVLALHPNIIGLKDSSGNMNYFGELGKLFKNSDFYLYVGPEERLAESLSLGARGGVNGGSNLFPKLYVNLFDAFSRKDFEEVNRLQTQIQKLSDLVYNLTDSPNAYLQGLKSAMCMEGLCGDILAPPLKSLNQIARNQLIENLKELH